MTPKYLDNSPLYSAIIEIRFSTKIPEDAVPGVMYSKLSETESVTPIMTALPAAQLPIQLRQQDPNLRYAPTQRIVVAGKTINVGSNVLSLEASNAIEKRTYPGWEDFYSQFILIFEQMDFISQVERVAVRYINVFQEDDFIDKLNIKLKTGWESKGLQANSSTVMFFVEKNSLKSKVTIASDAAIQDDKGQKHGQIIDIDTYLEGAIPSEDVDKRVDEAHKLTKEMFYSFPGKELMARMGPHER